VVQARLRTERNVARILAERGYEEFLPVYRHFHTCARRKTPAKNTYVERPLFPGYIFFRFTEYLNANVITVPGVIRIVGTRDGPLPVDDEEIAGLKRVVKLALDAKPCAFVTTGQVVRIGVGPLSGLEGIVLREKNRHQLILSVQLLQRSVAVEIDRMWLDPSRSFHQALCCQERSKPARDGRSRSE
jgi:transcription termination/antitermination protein NusG